MQAPYLAWAGKAERTAFEVDTVSLHVHERVDPATILAHARKRLKGEKAGEVWRQADLFAAPFENLPLRQALDFYKHEKGWSNRLIAGDSLLVMNSLLEKEGMAGKVQMIYIDPPYGIKYGSNFQPFVEQARREGRRGRGPDPGTRDDQGVPGHLGARHPLLPDLPARPAAAGAGTAARERVACSCRFQTKMCTMFGNCWTRCSAHENFVSVSSFIKTTGSDSGRFCPQYADYLRLVRERRKQDQSTDSLYSRKGLGWRTQAYRMSQR